MNDEEQQRYLLARSKLWTPELDKLLRKWRKQLGKKEQAHRDVAQQNADKHYRFGVPAVILGALTSSSIFATFQNCNNDDQGATVCAIIMWIRFTFGIIGLVSMAFSAALTFLNYQQTAEDHKSAADLFGERYREIDSLLQIPGALRGDPISTLQNIRSQYDNDVRNAPGLPKKYEIELTYEVVGNTHRVVPPPADVVIQMDNMGQSVDDDLLSKLLNGSSTSKSHTENLEEAIERANGHDTDDDVEVCLAYDLDAVPNYNEKTTALAVAALQSRQTEQEQQSLQRRLMFELQRMENSPRSGHTRLKKSDASPRSGHSRLRRSGPISQAKLQKTSVKNDNEKELPTTSDDQKGKREETSIQTDQNSDGQKENFRQGSRRISRSSPGYRGKPLSSSGERKISDSVRTGDGKGNYGG